MLKGRLLNQTLTPRMLGFQPRCYPLLPTKAVDVMGWRIDLDKETIRPNDKGIRKLFFVLFVLVDNDAK